MGLSKFAKVVRTADEKRSDEKEKAEAPPARVRTLLRGWSRMEGNTPIDDAVDDVLDDEEEDEHEDEGRGIDDATADAVERAEGVESVDKKVIRDQNARAKRVPVTRIPMANGAARFIYGRATKR